MCSRSCPALASYQGALDRRYPEEATKVERFARWCLALAIVSGVNVSDLDKALEEPPQDYPYPELEGLG